MKIDGFHLPGLKREPAIAERRYHDVSVRVPDLGPDDLAAIAGHVRAAAVRLRDRPVDDIVRAIDAAAGTLADPDHEMHRTALRTLPAVTGYSRPMIELVLERMSRDWRADALRRLLRAELGRPEALDRFVATEDERRVRALGPGLAFHVFAGNVPGVAVTAIVRSLLTKAATLGKTASGEPVLPALFAHALRTVDPELADCLAVTYWTGGESSLEDAAIRAADTVVVYGGEHAATAIAGKVTPPKRLVVHGPRLSVAMIARERLTHDGLDELADAAAYATAICDQQGCVSPHTLFAERGGEIGAAQLARRIAAALQRIEHRLPRGRIRADEAAAIRDARTRAEFREIDGQDARVLPAHDAPFTVIYQETAEFQPSPLNRVLRVHPVDDLDSALRHIAGYGRFIQSVALEAPPPRRSRLAEQIARIGATRITTLRQMPWPPPHWHHDGRGPLVELLRWVDLEG